MKRFSYHNFKFYNHSIPETKAINASNHLEIEDGIRRQIRGCSTLLVLADKGSTDYWIRKEIDIAKELNKEIIAVKPRGYDSVSNYLQNNADKIFTFNAKDIIQYIKR